jgi:hypothetical protein
MGFLTGEHTTRTRYLVEIGRGPQYALLFWWGCQVGEHSAWAWLDGSGREAVREEALPPVLRARAVVHRVARVDGRQLREWHDRHDVARK